MKNYRLLNVLLIWSICSLASTASAGADTRWSRYAPADTGFSVEVPGELRPGEAEEDTYVYSSKGTLYLIWFDANTEGIPQLLERNDRKGIKRELEMSRDVVFRDFEATRRGSTSTDAVDGYPSMRFSFEYADADCNSMVVITSEYTYTVLAVRPKGTSDDDARRFIRSFRLVTPAADRP